MRIELTQDGECWHVWIDGQHRCDLCGTSLSEVLDLLRAKLPAHTLKT